MNREGIRREIAQRELLPIDTIRLLDVRSDAQGRQQDVRYRVTRRGMWLVMADFAKLHGLHEGRELLSVQTSLVRIEADSGGAPDPAVDGIRARLFRALAESLAGAREMPNQPPEWLRDLQWTAPLRIDHFLGTDQSGRTLAITPHRGDRTLLRPGEVLVCADEPWPWPLQQPDWSTADLALLKPPWRYLVAWRRWFGDEFTWVRCVVGGDPTAPALRRALNPCLG